MEWGLAKVDDLGLDSFIEATGIGQSLYAQYGYRPIRSVNVDMITRTLAKNGRNCLHSCRLGIQLCGGLARVYGEMGSHRSPGKSDWSLQKVEVRSKKLAIHLGATQD